MSSDFTQTGEELVDLVVTKGGFQLRQSADDVTLHPVDQLVSV